MFVRFVDWLKGGFIGAYDLVLGTRLNLRFGAIDSEMRILISVAVWCLRFWFPGRGFTVLRAFTIWCLDNCGVAVWIQACGVLWWQDWMAARYRVGG